MNTFTFPHHKSFLQLSGYIVRDPTPQAGVGAVAPLAQSWAVCYLTSCRHGYSRFKDGEVSATSLGRVLACEDEKHFLFIPEASDSDGGLYKVRAANYQNSQLVASSSSDKWSMAEVLDSISVDWQTWFGTLCVLLWLLYLIVL